MAIDQQHRCVHYENDFRLGYYVDCKIDGMFFGFCLKCFRRFQHKKGVEVIRYINGGVKFAPPVDIPF